MTTIAHKQFSSLEINNIQYSTNKTKYFIIVRLSLDDENHRSIIEYYNNLCEKCQENEIELFEKRRNDPGPRGMNHKSVRNGSVIFPSNDFGERDESRWPYLKLQINDIGTLKRGDKISPHVLIKRVDNPSLTDIRIVSEIIT